MESIEDFYQRPLIRKYGRFLTQTKITRQWIKDLDNGIVFVEMPIENPQQVQFLWMNKLKLQFESQLLKIIF